MKTAKLKMLKVYIP